LGTLSDIAGLVSEDSSETGHDSKSR
jgi:hypothetical protein